MKGRGNMAAEPGSKERAGLKDMQITKIEKIGRKCRLYLNDTPAFCLYPSEIRKLSLTEGMELSQETQEEIYGEILEKRAKKRSLLILKSADKTGQQLVEKLRGDEYPEEIVQKALAYVESYGYVDDLRYAKDYIESTGGSRSKKRIFSDLLRKGISADLIEKAFEEAGEPDEETQIRLLMEKRGFDPEAADRSERDKMVRYLLGKGYAYEQIRRGFDYR